ncbi:endonuclease/exonuclease/phosphatase family protein [Microlunatus sagamiharensis]|uniref:endonuclease/exonuclease/phosphatase family protein n=1 Tax=Microlunatus sagamiharensis TaxID=546874 RepID=UPI000B840C67|nr:endonuclease/exonuclease/phosphatase family protein [Microlunatus sagamiharensis]
MRAGTAERPAWDSTPTRPRRRRATLVAALLLLVPAVGTTLLRVGAPTDDLGALLASFVPYGLPLYLLALLLLVVALVLSRRRAPVALLTVLVAALTALHVSWVAPFFVPDDRPVVGPSFTVLAQNVYLGRADTERLGEVASGADVVVLSETDRGFLERLQTPGWDARFPYAVGALGGPPSDTTIFSRYPLTDAEPLPGSLATQWVMTVDVPGRSPLRLLGVHPCNPYCAGGAFAGDHAALETAVRDNLSMPLVVAGDLNAIDDHAPLQRLRADGMRSAADLVGAGWVPTWPADRAFPPLLPIDHVLVDDRLTATSLETVRMPGSDHLGLLATLAGTS